MAGMRGNKRELPKRDAKNNINCSNFNLSIFGLALIGLETDLTSGSIGSGSTNGIAAAGENLNLKLAFESLYNELSLNQ
jgi:hypothetical protein